MRIAYEFYLEISINDKGQKECGMVKDMTHSLVSDTYWARDSMDFEYDISSLFIDCNQQIEKLEPGLYHIFEYGIFSGETSYTEYGPEFDGWLIEPEYTDIQKIEVIKE